jgi:predicted KAP-like P-loop ATPase
MAHVKKEAISETKKQLEFSNDKPLVSESDDQLNRAPFAERIAKILFDLPNGTGLSIGIHGPWGDGKTTVLNLLRSHLEKRKDLVVCEFNPWRLTGDEAMFRGFFSMLLKAIGETPETKSARVKSTIVGWIKKLRWFTKPASEFEPYSKMVDALLANLSDVIADGSFVGLEELRPRIIQQLQKSPKRIIVLIDDIDRLDKHEIHILFRLVKACADFPNVCFVMAFDDAVVAKSLNEHYGNEGNSGRAFLEKIIQVPLKLPVASKVDLRGLCFRQVDWTLAEAGIELTTKEIDEFVTGFDQVISLRLTTPRAAKRYANNLLFTLPMLKDETNHVDLLLVEALHAFFPELFDVVRDNYSDFCGVEKEWDRDNKNPRYTQLLLPIFETMTKQQADNVRRFLCDLFPRLQGAYRNTFYGHNSISQWSKEKRIASPEYCLRYFVYGVPRNDIPDAKISEIIEKAFPGNEAWLEMTLSEYLSDIKSKQVIEKLRALEETVDFKNAEVLILVLAKLGKVLPNPQVVYGFLEPPSQTAILISHLLKRIEDATKRMEVIKRILETAEPLWFGDECLRWLHVTDKPEKEEDNVLTNEEVAEVRKILVDRIKSQSESGSNLFTPEYRQEHNLLFLWSIAEGRGPVQAHLVKLFEKDASNVSLFLYSLAQRAWSNGELFPHISEFNVDNLKFIDRLIDLDVLTVWIQKHCPGDFKNPQWRIDNKKPLDKGIAESFMYVYNEMKKGNLGQNQDSNKLV